MTSFISVARTSSRTGRAGALAAILFMSGSAHIACADSRAARRAEGVNSQFNKSGRGNAITLYRALGAAGLLTEARGGQASSGGVGAAAFALGTSYFSMESLSIRYMELAYLGGGANALEGGAALNLGVGGRLKLGKLHSLILRGAFAAEVQGNDAFKQSELTPSMHWAYQYASKKTLLEVGAVTGWMWLGAFRVHKVRENSNNEPSLGLITSLGTQPFQVDLSYDRTPLTTHALEDLQARGCLMLDRVAFCGYFRRSEMTAEEKLQMTQGGLILGFGRLKRL